MSFDLTGLRAAVAAHGIVARVVITDVKGSAPREVGAAMLVWSGGQSGTIGGGRLEWDAAALAHRTLADGRLRAQRMALGPDLGQCCGGNVQVLIERFDADSLPEMPYVRPLLSGQPAPQAHGLTTGSYQGWFVEPEAAPTHHLFLYGAGHVGRAIVTALAPLPGLAITWVDTAPERFPQAHPEDVTCLPVPDPARAVTRAPKDAHHLILTYSHEMDLALCHAVLRHGFASAGLIGSKTKWARFRKRLEALGHSRSEINTITCPIGDPSLGRHPQAIALGVATALLASLSTARAMAPASATEQP